MIEEGTALYTYEDRLVEGRYVDRPNRFTIDVAFGQAENGATDDAFEGATDDAFEGATDDASDGPTDTTTDDAFEGDPVPVYLRNSGGLGTVLEPGRRVLCRHAATSDRKTDYDAIAVAVRGTWVTVDATLPNRIVEACLTTDALPGFEGYEVDRAEPPLPAGGRADFLCRSPDGGDACVEVKSNTHVVDGVSKFPDRPTERGRRHLRHLADLAETGGTAAHLVFVVQRPDVDRVRPFVEVDPEFADLLSAAAERGVSVTALATAFDPPTVALSDPAVPVDIDWSG